VSAVRSERVEDGVQLVTLDRPRANAVDVATSHALHDAFAAAEADPAVRVTVLTGAGTAFFSAGWDLKAAAAGEAVDADHGPGGFAGLTEMWQRRTPVVAAVNGLALGGGLELALAADLVVAAEHAELALPEVTLGLVADSGGLLRLRRALPHAVASEMLLTGRRMGAHEAARWGLVNRVTTSEALLEGALDLARAVVRAAPLAVAAVLEVEQETAGLDVRDGFGRMRSGSLPTYDSVLGSEDALEGPRAFAERRPPRWVGHRTAQQNREGTP
jgi:crotonobetainyl-CoA hydratase